MRLSPAEIEEALAMPDLPEERVHEIMRQLWRRAETIWDMEKLGDAPLIPDDAV